MAAGSSASGGCCGSKACSPTEVPPLPVPDPPLADGPTRVRGWRDEDLAARVEAWRDPGLMRFMLQQAPAEPSLEDAAEWLAVREGRRESGQALFLVVAERDSDEAVGAVWLWNVSLAEGCGEVGYWLLEHGRGRGHATRAVRLLVAYAFDRLGLERIELLTLPDNEPSKRVAERAGFQSEGLLRSYRRGGDRRAHMLIYSRLRED